MADAIAKMLSCKKVSFPDDTSPHTGEAIRSYLRREWHVRARGGDGGLEGALSEQLGAKALQALALANRLERWPDLANAANAYRWDLVLARYWPSGWVYGQLDGLDRRWIEACNVPFPAPDLCVLLDAPADVCMARRAARDGKAVEPERYEGKLAVAEKVIALYRELWSGVGETLSPSTTWAVVDATKPIEEVISAVKALVGDEMATW